MKKTLLTLGIAWLAFSSCSKEDDQSKYLTSFFFKVKCGGKEIVEYGHYEYNYNESKTIYEGPKFKAIQQNDSSIIYVWPDYTDPALLSTPIFPILFSKKGTDVKGDYSIHSQRTLGFQIYTTYTGLINYTDFVIIPGTEKLSIITRSKSKDGDYAEGTLDFKTYADYDTIPIPATATFRLKME